MKIRFISLFSLMLLLASPCLNAAQDDFINQQNQLHQAILNDSGKEVMQVIAAVSTQGQGDQTAEWFLVKAIMTENAAGIKDAAQRLITEGKNGNSPAIWAALLRKPNALIPLLECGVKLDANIAMYAVKVGDFQMALSLIKSGIDISTVIQDCMLHCFKSDFEMAFELIQELINRGYDVNKVWGQLWRNRISPKNRIKIIELFIKNGANLNYEENKCLPLLIAIGQGNVSLIKFLLDSGADIQKLDRAHKKRPLEYAVSLGRASIAELLLSYGAQY